MLRSKRDKNRATEVSRLSNWVLVTGLVFGWSQPAFSDERSHLQLAPIIFSTNVGGNIGYFFQSYSEGSKTSRQQTLGGDINLSVGARSYLWQPWFSRLSGSLGADISSALTHSSNSPNTKTVGTVLTGESNLNILPYTRFPFAARAYRINTQADGFLSGINSNYIKSGLDISQDYRSLDGRLNSSARYNHATSRRGNSTPEAISNQLNFYFITHPLDSNNTFNVVGGMTKVEHPLQRDTYLTDSLVTTHLYQPNAVVSVSNLLSLVKANYTLTPIGGTRQQNDYNSQQFSSFSSWRPEGSPLTLTGSARLLKVNSLNNGNSTSQISDTNLNLGANYAWSRFLRMYGSVNVSDNSGIQTISTAAGLSAQKGLGQQESINVGGYRYSRYFGASLGNQTTTTTNKNQTITNSVQQLGGSVGHDLSKSTSLGSGFLTRDFNQGLSTLISTKGSPSTHFNNNGSLIWNSNGEKVSSIVSLRASDSRTLSNPQNFFQLINFQASRNERLVRNQSLLGNLTIQASRSGASGQTTPFTASSSADLTYRNERLFKVKNLSFESALRIQGREIELTKNMASQQDLATQSHTSISWDNNLDYFIGRLKIRLVTRILAVNNVTTTNVMFSMLRSF